MQTLPDGRTLRNVTETVLPVVRGVSNPFGKPGPIDTLGFMLPGDDTHFRIFTVLRGATDEFFQRIGQLRGQRRQQARRRSGAQSIPMTTPQHDTPVLIAGSGPVGITLAMDLAWRGVKSIVLEARQDLPPSPRCNTTNARSMEIFRRLGCADAIRAAGLPAEHSTVVVYMMAMNGEEFTRFELYAGRLARADCVWTGL